MIKLFSDNINKRREEKQKKKEEKARIRNEKSIAHEDNILLKESTSDLFKEATIHLLERERIVLYTPGLFLSRTFSDSTEIQGLLIATDKRVIVYGKHMLGFDVESIYYKDMVTTDFSKVNPCVLLSFNSSNKGITFRSMLDIASKNIMSYVNERIAHEESNEVLELTSFDNIKQYKELFDLNIICKEEYEIKVREVLQL